jgi:hypothetical protein
MNGLVADPQTLPNLAEGKPLFIQRDGFSPRAPFDFQHCDELGGASGVRAPFGRAYERASRVSYKVSVVLMGALSLPRPRRLTPSTARTGCSTT